MITEYKLANISLLHSGSRGYYENISSLELASSKMNSIFYLKLPKGIIALGTFHF